MGFTLDLGKVSPDGTGLIPRSGDTALGSERRQQWLAMRERFASIDPTVGVVEHDRLVSFAFDEPAIALTLSENEAWFEGPYTSGDDEQSRWLSLGELIRVVQEETSWSLFNPQTDRIETVEEMLAGSGLFPASPAKPTTEETSETHSAKSKRKRLFGKKR